MPKKALVIEDEEIVRNIYKKLFDNENYELFLTSLGQKGVELLRNNPDIELVLLDAGLPDIDGFTILEKIQTINPDIPIIMISGFDLAEKIYNLTKPDYVYFLKKPFSIEDLYNTIHKVMDNNE